MTMQVPDTVIYNDVAYETDADYVNLFKPYLKKHHIKLFVNCTAIWRGYIAAWKIENDMLYLVEIYANVIGAQSQGCIKCSESTIFRLLADEAVGMDYFFPNQSKVFADWYSGNLSVHNENVTKRESVYLIFKIDKGHIIGQEQATEQEYYNYLTYK